MRDDAIVVCRAMVEDKFDMDIFESRLAEECGKLRADFGSRMDALGGEIRSDVQGLRGEVDRLRGDSDNLRGDMANLRGDMVNLRGEMRREMENLRHEMRSEMAALRAELRGDMEQLRLEVRSDLRVEIANTRADLLKWSFLFWVGQVAAVTGLMSLLR